jgi:hypothetical protein
MRTSFLFNSLACTAASFLCCNYAFAQQDKPGKLSAMGTVIKSSPTMPVVDNGKTDRFMQQLLQQYPQYFNAVLANRKKWNVQIIYTQVDRGANSIPDLKNYYFNVNEGSYFYPASTVKLPICLLALQKVNELKEKGISSSTTMITGQAGPGQTAVYNDPTTPDGKPTIEHYIKKILMVSDNDAYNRLYEFLGPQYINDQLHQKGYGDVQILHRLNIAMSREQNRATNPINFLDTNNRVVYSEPAQYDSTSYSGRHDSIGTAYYIGDSLIQGAMDFSAKNRISLQDLHTILVSLVFPVKVTAAQRFNITADDRNFVLNYMSQLPTESVFPPYAADTANYWPAYCKFLLYGSQKGELSKNIRIFNKVGDAYGQLIDVAYIVDFEKKIEFFLSAAIYCNSDGVLNDDHYDYDSIGFPFMKQLGEVLYQYELSRERKVVPNLSSLIFEYDKAR